jgi:glyoxylase-like metal-dependent hydrolase (beta-lactamase superfamily II)
MTAATASRRSETATHDLGDGLRVVSFVTDSASSHLVVLGRDSVLIDCHDAGLSGIIAAQGLPSPRLIMHTHVQPEHCRESDAFAGAVIAVRDTLRDLAEDSPAYRAACRTIWDKPQEWMDTLGREAYGIGGAVTQFPPSPALRVGQTFRPGDVIRLADAELEVIDLPGHGQDAAGFVLRRGGRALALFSGDLLRHPASLVNMYDLEYAYGPTRLPQLPDLLERVAGLNVPLLLPSTGPALERGPEALRQLACKIRDYHAALQWKPPGDRPAPTHDYPTLGRYLKLHEGIYQINNYGNCIVLIDEQGRGLFVDPGPCDFESPRRIEDFHRDLDLLHERAGLRTVEVALITHFHGDHYDLVPQLKRRYAGCRTVAWEPLARVIEEPERFPYPCKLPWYNLGLGAMPVDVKLHRSTTWRWNDIAITTLHLPGHCFVHAGYMLTFRGLRLAITGDTIQTRGESESLNYIIVNHSVPDSREGCLAAYEAVLRHEVDLNLGGHSSHFTDCRRLYEASLARMRHAQAALRTLLHDGDLTRAFRRPCLPDLGTLD